jgi:hypothetical protein
VVAVERHTADAMAEALRKARGIKVVAAKMLGCSRVTVQNYCNRYASVQAAAEEARETLIDVAEGKLVQRVDAGDWDAVRFVLVTIGKGRGYVMRQEATGADGGPIQMDHSVAGALEVRPVDYRVAAAPLLTDSGGE